MIKGVRDFPGKRATRWISETRVDNGGGLVNRLGKISQRGLSFIAAERNTRPFSRGGEE